MGKREKFLTFRSLMVNFSILNSFKKFLLESAKSMRSRQFCFSPKIISFVLLLNFFVVAQAFAAFNLSVEPVGGGYDLRFQRLSPEDFKQTKEVLVRVSSDIGRQYRVFQRIARPLSSNDGREIPSEQFKMYALPGSNSRGTLIYREESPVNQFDTMLYSSDPSGTGDSFKLVYTLSPVQRQLPGTYQGRISFVLIPIDSSQSQIVVTLNVYAELAGGLNPVFELKTQDHSGRIHLAPQSDQTLRERVDSIVAIGVQSPVGAAYKIYQQLDGSGIVSAEGDYFDLSKVGVSFSALQKGRLGQPETLYQARTKELIYASDENGSPDELKVVYAPSDDLRLMKAGRYRGRISFVAEIEGAQGMKLIPIRTLDIDIEIPALFNLMVSSPDGRQGVNLQFGDVSYKTGPKTSEVIISVETNMKRPYKVIQRVASPMVNEFGDRVSEEDFKFWVKEVDDKISTPRLVLFDPRPVAEGDTVIFASSVRGEETKFKVVYELTMRPDSKGGRYDAQIGYSLLMN